MNYAKLCLDDATNGIGYRTTLFVSGCGKQPKCKGCFNKDAWDFNFGFKYTEETKEKILNNLSKTYIRGFSLLGGEPTDNLYDGLLLDLVKSIKILYPNKTIYCWTGYTFEELIKDPIKLEFLQYVDMLRDGEFSAYSQLL